jgi:hypothetical protein
MERKVSTGTVGVGYDSRGNKLTQSSVVSNHALKLIGEFRKFQEPSSAGRRMRTADPFLL